MAAQPHDSHRDGDRVARLQQLTRALARAASADEVAAVAVEAGLAAASSAVGGLWLRDGDDLVAVHAQWAGTDQPNRLTRFATAAQMPAAEAFRTGDAVWVGDPASSMARYPELRPPPQGYFALPLVGTSGVLGVLAGRHNLGASPSEDDRTFLMTVADLCAQALQRTQAYERERRARETLEFLADATAVMVTALEPREVLDTLVRLAVPRLATWCAVYAVDDGALVQTAVASTFGDRGAAVTPRERLPLDVDTVVTRVVRTGVPEVVHIDEALLGAYYAPDMVERLVALNDSAGLIVPIGLRGETVGLLVLAAAGDSEEFRYAATALADRAAIAFENARRHRQQHDVVRTLTEALLPADVPAVDGYELAARYVPSSEGVCGDWYDAEVGPDGTLWFAVGDASGHGIAAAATMALARNAALGIREAEREPARLLSVLSRVVEHARGSDIVTALHGILEPASGHIRWASAGHPHGIAVSATGEVQELAGVHGPPLGVHYDHDTNRYRLEPGGTIVLYTDGVVERRGEGIWIGVKRLIDVVAASLPATAAALGDRIVEELCANPDDDCCVLIIQRAREQTTP